MMRDYDVAVVGGGPAGCAAALTALRTGSTVVLLERDEFPRHKVCGEFVSPEAQELLNWLLGSQSKLIEHAPQISRARLMLDGRRIELPIDPPARSISRYELDAALWQQTLTERVDARVRAEVIEVQGTAPFTITMADGSALGAAAVINASGRWSKIGTRREQFNSSEPSWIGLKAHFAEENPPESVDLYFFDGGYCGVQRIDSGTINASAMVRAEKARSLDAVLQLNTELRERSRTWRAVTEVVSTAPLFFAEMRPVSGGILQAGDAACFVDPFAGDGIALALRSGALAAECLAPYIAGRQPITECAKRYDRQYRARFAKVFRNAAMLRRALMLPYPLRIPIASALSIPFVGEMAVRATRG